MKETELYHPMSITLPLEADGKYDFHVDWGDGSSDRINSHDQPEVTHTFTRTGAYVVSITGVLEGFCFGFVKQEKEQFDFEAGLTHPSCLQIKDISQWYVWEKLCTAI